MAEKSDKSGGGFLSKMRRSPRGPGKPEPAALSFETLQGLVQSGTTEEIRAALNSQEKSVRVGLLSHRDEGWTLFHLACQLGKLQTAFCLLEMGSDVNAATPNGTTGLHFLSLLGKEECTPPMVYLQLLAELLKKGANMNLLNSSGESVLHMATSRKNELAVGFFLDANGCDLNLQTRHGDTALHYAVNQNCLPCLQKLLDKGAIDKPNAAGSTAAELAAKNKQAELVALFDQHAVAVKAAAIGSTGAAGLGVSGGGGGSGGGGSVGGGGGVSGAGKLSKGVSELKLPLASQQSSSASSSSSSSSGRGVSQGPMTSPLSDADDIRVWTAPEADPFADEDAVVPLESQLQGLAMGGCWDTYRNEFFGKRHFVYYNSGGEERAIAVVLSRPSPEGLYRGLAVIGGDWQMFSFSAELLVLYSGTADESEQIRQVISTNKPTNEIQWSVFRNSPTVNNGSALLALEAKLAMRPRICVGVILGLPGQTKEAEMFENSTTTPEFEAFLNVLGERIEVSKWRHWRGTFAAGEEQPAFYAAWRGFEFVFHVSTMLDAAKQRQHIGNDTVLVYYKMGSEKVEEGFRGKVNACALVVSASSSTPRSLSFSAFYRSWIDGFVPVLPHTSLLLSQAAVLREVIFTNAINCSYAAVKSGPYKQNRIRLYDGAISELVTAEENAAGNGDADGESGVVSVPSSGAKKLHAPLSSTPSRKKQQQQQHQQQSHEKEREKSPPPQAEKAVLVMDKVQVATVPQLDELKSGWLMKRKSKLKKPSAWKKRWCVLRDDGLSYYEKDSGHDDRMGVISWAQIQSVELGTAPNGTLQMSLNCVACDYDFASCSDGSDLKSWASVLALKSQVSLQDVSSLLSKPAVVASGPPPPRPAPRSAGGGGNAAASSGGGQDASSGGGNSEKLAETVKEAMVYVRKKGLLRTNIFRIVEDQNEVDALAQSWEKGQRTEMEKEGVDIVAGAIRKYFRDLSNLFKVEELELLVQASKRPPEEQLEQIRSVMIEKPLLMLLFDLLNKVDEKSAFNKMSASNLAAVFAPTFLRELKNVSLLLDYTKAIVSVVQFVITHFACCRFKEVDFGWAHHHNNVTSSPPPPMHTSSGGGMSLSGGVSSSNRRFSSSATDISLVKLSRSSMDEDEAALQELREQEDILVELDEEELNKPISSGRPQQSHHPLPHLPNLESLPKTATEIKSPPKGGGVSVTAPRKKAPMPPPYKAPKPRGGNAPADSVVPSLSDDPSSPRMSPTPVPRKPSRNEPLLVPPLEDDDVVTTPSKVGTRSPAVPRIARTPPTPSTAQDPPSPEDVPLVPVLDDPFG